MGVGRIVIDLLTTVAAIFVGTVVYKKMNTFYKSQFYYTILYLLVDIVSLTFNNNAWIFNLLIFAETCMMFFAVNSLKVLTNKRYSPVLLLMLGLFTLTYFTEIIWQETFKKSVFVAMLSSAVMLSGIFIHVLYKQLSERVEGKINLPLVIICSGLVIYFSTTVPMLALLKTSQTEEMKSLQSAFQIIVVNAATLRYLLTAIGFILLIKSENIKNTN